MAYLYSFILGGVEVKDYVLMGTKIELSRNNLLANTAEIRLANTVTNVVAITNGMSVVVSRGVDASNESYKFRGHVKRVRTHKGTFILTCKCEINKLNYDEFTKSYDVNIDAEAGELSAIFKDIGEDGGFTVSTEDSGTSASDITADKFISRRKKRLERMRKISKTLNWHFYYDYDNQHIRHEPKGFETYATELVVGTNIMNIPKWVHDIEPMRNKITVEGAVELDTRTENEVGDGVTKTFYFTYRPVGTECTVNGTPVKQGVASSSESYDYYIEADQLSYTFLTAPTNGHAIVMNYTTPIPRPVTRRSNASITEYGLTQEETYKFKDLFTVDDANRRCKQMLKLLKDGKKHTTIMTTEMDLKPGMKINLTDSTQASYDGEYIVHKVIINYPEPVDTIKIGDEDIDIAELFATIEERIKLLEADDTSLYELLRSVIDSYKIIHATRESFTKTRKKICDSFIVGHKVNGLVGMGTILDSCETGSAANWSGSDFTLSDSTTQKILGTHSIKAIWAGGASTGYLLSTQSLGDLSAYTGVNSGLPNKGTTGLWVYVTDSADLTTLTLRIGSSASDYLEVAAKAYASVDGYENFDSLTFSLQDGWNYILFDLDGGNITGTPDWTNCDYVRLICAFPANTTIYLDYFTMSKSDYVGLNGVGCRKMTMET